MDPTLDPNAPVRAGTGQDEIFSQHRLIIRHCEKTLFGTRRNAPIRPPSNFKTGALTARLSSRIARRNWGVLLRVDPLVLELTFLKASALSFGKKA